MRTTVDITAGNVSQNVIVKSHNGTIKSYTHQRNSAFDIQSQKREPHGLKF